VRGLLAANVAMNASRLRFPGGRIAPVLILPRAGVGYYVVLSHCCERTCRGRPPPKQRDKRRLAKQLRY